MVLLERVAVVPVVIELMCLARLPAVVLVRSLL
jgi:hypothetical protein